MRNNIILDGDSSHREVAEGRYPYLKPYLRDSRLHIVHCLCYPDTVRDFSRENMPGHRNLRENMSGLKY
jgi:hypothetical protein